ncbi:MAG: hypothetical protein AAF050_16845, partial [Cyanobacteria bacterium J06649_5]
MDPSESEHRPASFSDSSENSQPTSGPSQQQSAEDISIAGEDNAIALANAAGNVTIDQSQRGSIRIEESTVGSAIISGNGNIVYVVHQATEPKNIKASEEPFSDVGPNPYKGLAAFKESNAHQYFGREAQVKRLWQRFQSLYEQSGQANAVPRLLPILGPSGSGKSSLARAGLIPELARHPLPGKEQMRIAVLVPGTHPLETLAGVLAKAATQDPMPVAKTREFATELKLKNESGLYDGMRRIVDLIPQIKDMPLIVLVDQFEEVYSLCQAADERDSFIENLLCAASSPTGNVSVVLTLRSDFLGETQRHKLLNQVICSDRSVIVPVMTEAELRRAIAEPAKQAGHPLDAATVNLLVKDTEGREGALPLLQFALTRIWAGLSEGKAPADTYEAMGGVGGALAGKAQDIYNELDDAEKDMVRRVFIGLVQLGEGTRDTRRRAAVSSLMASRDTPEAIKQVIHRFSSPGARLVTLSSQAGKEIAEVTHEALFDHWQLLNDWLDSGRDDIRFQRRLDAAADYWKEQDYPEGSLWRRPDLDLLKSYHRQASHEMTPLQLSFFRASMRAAQRRKIFMSMGVGSLVMLSAATSLLAITAQRTKRESLASQLATKSEWIGSQSSVLRTTSALLAVKASETFNHDLNAAPLEIDQALRSGLKFLPDFKHQLPHESEVLATSFSPNSQIIATASTDNAAWLWAADTGEKIATLPHEDEVLAVNFSPSGQTVATASADNTARIWNVDTGEKIVTLPHEDKVLAVSFSPSGQTVATASADNTARIWNADTREKIAILPHEDKVLAVSFSPSGQTVATASSDSTARLWDADTGKTIAILQHEAPVLAVNFSPNGQTVATASYDNTARLWNADTGEETATLNHDAIVSTVSFSPDGQTVATASADNTARFWNADTGEETATLNHEATVSAVSFSPDGQTAATVSHDNIARLWSAEAGEEIATFNHEATVSAVSFSPNGQTVATASYDNTARLWSTDTEEEIAAFQHEAPVLAVSFGPNGQTIATASYDNTARLWSTDTKEEIAIFQHEAPVLAVSFGPNGQTVATASADNTARLWSTDTKEEIAVLQHEAPVLAVSFGPNGQTIVTTSDDGTARLWEADTGEKIATLQHETTVRAANLSPNGKTVATASDDGTAWLWAADTGKKIAILQHEAPVSAVSFGPNSKTVATASADNTARLWSANTGEELATLNHE